MTHNSHNRNNGGGHKDSLKNDLALFTGFKSALEACYLDWEEYTLPGITYTAGSNPMYHCPFTCFRHVGDTRTEVNQVSVSICPRQWRIYQHYFRTCSLPAIRTFVISLEKILHTFFVVYRLCISPRWKTEDLEIWLRNDLGKHPVSPLRLPLDVLQFSLHGFRRRVANTLLHFSLESSGLKKRKNTSTLKSSYKE